MLWCVRFHEKEIYVEIELLSTICLVTYFMPRWSNQKLLFPVALKTALWAICQNLNQHHTAHNCQREVRQKVCTHLSFNGHLHLKWHRRMPGLKCQDKTYGETADRVEGKWWLVNSYYTYSKCLKSNTLFGTVLKTNQYLLFCLLHFHYCLFLSSRSS